MPGVRYAVADVSRPHRMPTLRTIGCAGKPGRAAEGDDRLLISTDALCAILGRPHASGWVLACGWLVDMVGSEAIMD